jgi:hypothetical protein
VEKRTLVSFRHLNTRTLSHITTNQKRQRAINLQRKASFDTTTSNSGFPLNEKGLVQKLSSEKAAKKRKIISCRPGVITPRSDSNMSLESTARFNIRVTALSN